MEDVHRAGGVVAILGELARAGLVHTDLPSACMAYLAGRGRWSAGTSSAPRARACGISTLGRARRRADAGGVQPGPQASRSLDDDRSQGCIRDAAPTPIPGTAASPCSTATSPPTAGIVKTAGVDAGILKFAGRRRACLQSQDAAVEAILTNRIKPGDIVVIIYEGPRGGPGMQEMLYPTSYLKSKGASAKPGALITDGRFSGGSSGPSRSATSRRKPPKAA